LERFGNCLLPDETRRSEGTILTGLGAFHFHAAAHFSHFLFGLQVHQNGELSPAIIKLPTLWRSGDILGRLAEARKPNAV
jgi:hypothetical protein